MASGVSAPKKGVTTAAGADGFRVPTDGEGRPLRVVRHVRCLTVFGCAPRAHARLSRKTPRVRLLPSIAVVAVPQRTDHDTIAAAIGEREALVAANAQGRSMTATDARRLPERSISVAPLPFCPLTFLNEPARLAHGVCLS